MRGSENMAGYSLDESLPYLMNRLVGHLNRALERDLRSLGLTFQHWRVLAVLAARDDRAIAELADYAVVPHSTLSRLLTRMEREGLVARTTTEADLRLAKIHLTAKGRRTYERILPLAIGWRDVALAGMTTTDSRAALQLLKRMLTNLEAHG